jgi:AcrR family transcriptional regulator
MPAMASPARPLRKARHHYHHGDLRRALIEAAVRTIQASGIAGLTLRGVGADLGVSRTALYRHFDDKSALLAAVAREGFRTLRIELEQAWSGAGGGRAGFGAMGRAYVRFATAHPSHYRVMFGGSVTGYDSEPELDAEASGAFQALVDALSDQQKAGLVRDDDPLQLARFIWAVVHGLAMLAIDGQLGQPGADLDALTDFAVERAWSGIALEKGKERRRGAKKGGA